MPERVSTDVAVIVPVPVVATTSCPTAAAALASVGLGPVCQATSNVTGVVGSVASDLTGFGVNSVLDAVGSWVAGGASWLLSQIGTILGGTTSIDLGAGWFTAHYQTMAALAGVLIVPLLLLGIMQSIYRQSVSALLRSVLVQVPLALLLTAVAVKLVELGLAVTDAASDAVAQGAGLDSGHFMASVALGLSGSSSTGGSGTAPFVLLLGGLAVVTGALLLWIELLVRSSAVYVAVLFLPLALASLAWPAISHWTRRLVDTLAALILGKLVVVSVLSLAAGALAAGTGATPNGSAPDSGGGAGAPAGSFTSVLAGVALLFLSAAAPWALFRLLPFFEAGAVGHLEGLSQRARNTVSVPVRSLAQTAIRAAGGSSFAGAAAGLAAGTVGRAQRTGVGGPGTSSGGATAFDGTGGGGGRGGRGRRGRWRSRPGGHRRRPARWHPPVGGPSRGHRGGPCRARRPIRRWSGRWAANRHLPNRYRRGALPSPSPPDRSVPLRPARTR